MPKRKSDPAERQRLAAVERRAAADYEASTGEPWADVPDGAKVEYRNMAELSLRSEAAQPPADPARADPAPSPTSARAYADLTDVEKADLAERAARQPASIADVGRMLGQAAPIIREHVERAVDPLLSRIDALEQRLAQLDEELKA